MASSSIFLEIPSLLYIIHVCPIYYNKIIFKICFIQDISYAVSNYSINAWISNNRTSSFHNFFVWICNPRCHIFFQSHALKKVVFFSYFCVIIPFIYSGCLCMKNSSCSFLINKLFLSYRCEQTRSSRTKLT